MLINLEYLTLKITIHAKTPEAEADSLLLAGDIINRCISMENWGKPNVTIKIGALCPQCKTEVFLTDSLIENKFACPQCGAIISQDLLIPCETESALKKG